MYNLIPGVLILHIFGMILWLGASLIQYVYLSGALLSDYPEVRKWAMELNEKMNKTAVNIGLTIAILTGVVLLFLHGFEWFRPRLYVHFKLALGIVAAGLTHMGMAKLRKASQLVTQGSERDSASYGMLVGQWRVFLASSLVILGMNVILAIFKFSK